MVVRALRVHSDNAFVVERAAAVLLLVLRLGDPPRQQREETPCSVGDRIVLTTNGEAFTITATVGKSRLRARHEVHGHEVEFGRKWLEGHSTKGRLEDSSSRTQHARPAARLMRVDCRRHQWRSIAVRRAPSSSSEKLCALEDGETFEVLRRRGSLWACVRPSDRQKNVAEGWVMLTWGGKKVAVDVAEEGKAGREENAGTEGQRAVGAVLGAIRRHQRNSALLATLMRLLRSLFDGASTGAASKMVDAGAIEAVVGTLRHRRPSGAAGAEAIRTLDALTGRSADNSDRARAAGAEGDQGTPRASCLASCAATCGGSEG